MKRLQAIVYRPHYYVPVLGSCVCDHADLSTTLECLASGRKSIE